MICKAFLERNFSSDLSDRAEGSSLSLFYLVGENDFWWVRARFEPQHHGSPTQHCCGSSPVVESALVAAPQLWDTTITAIIQARGLTEPFNVCESDSESSLIIAFSSLEIHRHPGQPQSHICMTAQDKEKQLKVTVFFLPERASSGFDPKRPRQWEVGRTFCTEGLGGWDDVSIICSLCPLLLSVVAI